MVSANGGIGPSPSLTTSHCFYWQRETEAEQLVAPRWDPCRVQGVAGARGEKSKFTLEVSHWTTRPRIGLGSLRGMETWDVMRARRNVRSYSDRSIAPQDLDRILEAGRLSPSASNRQKWDFILVSDPAQLQALSTVWVGAKHLATARAAIVLVLPEPESERYRTIDQYDLGQATMSMLLAATDLGIGSGHSAIGDQEACRRILDTPADHSCAYMIALGYPADRPLMPLTKRDRRPFDEVVHRNKW
jgi:nitroreductase